MDSGAASSAGALPTTVGREAEDALEARRGAVVSLTRCYIPKPPVKPEKVGRPGPGCQEGPVIPNLRRYDWRCRVYV